jgi:autotransporter-associated beta strand protein
VYAGTYTWTGATSGNFGVSTNWDTAPTFNNTADLIFDAASANSTTASPSFLGAARTIRSISFGADADTDLLILLATTAADSAAANAQMTDSTGTASMIVSAGASGNFQIGNAVGLVRLDNNLLVDHNGSGNLTLRGITTGANQTRFITKNGTGTLVIGNGAGITYIYQGGIILNSGSIVMRNSNGSGLGTGAATLSLNGGALKLSVAINTAYGRNTTVSANSKIITSNSGGGSGLNYTLGTLSIGANTLTVDGEDFTSGTGQVTFGVTTLTGNAIFTVTNPTSGSGVTNLNLGAIGDGGSGFGLTKSGNGTLTINATHTYTGATVVNAGTLALGTAGNLSASTALTVSGTLTMNAISGSSLTVASLSGNSSGSVVMGAKNLIAGDSNNTDFGGVLSGTGASLTKNGSGTLTLSGANSYTGTTTINAGTLQIGNGGTTGSLSTSSAITNDGALAFNRSNTVTQGTDFTSTAIGGTGALVQNGSGTLVLGSANTYSGGTVFNAGTIQVDNANALHTSGNLTFGGGALRYGSGITQDFSSRIKNSGSAIVINTNGENITFGSVIDSSNIGGLTKNGAGDLTLSGANTFTGNVTLNTGRLILGNDSAMGGATGSIVINGGTIDVTAARTLSGNKAQNWNGNFTFAGSNTLNMGGGAVTLGGNSTVTVSASSLTVGGNISGSHGLGKSGAGSLVLSGSNSYTGATTINSGTVVFDGANALSSSTSLLDAGTATLSFLDGATNTTSVSGGLTLNNSAFIFDLSGSSADRLNFGGSASLSGTNTININFLSAASAGNFTLFTAAGGLNSSWSLDPSVIQSGFTFTLDQSSATQLVLIVASSSSGRYWTGEASNNWSGVNFSTTSGGSATLSGADLDGDSDLIFAGDTPSNLATIISSDYTIGSLAVSTPGVSINGSYTITANKTGDAVYSVTATSGTTNIGASLAGGGAGLTMAGGGTLALNGANTYSGNTTITSGTLAINNANAISNGTLIITGGSLNNTSGGAITLATNNAQSWNGDFAFVGTNDLNLGTGSVMLGATRLVTITAGNLTVEGSIGATAFGLTKEGAGTLVLSGSNAYTGTTTINAGTLRITGGNAISDSGVVSLANAAGVGFQVNSSETIASLQGGGAIGGTVTMASGHTLTVAESGSQTFSGVIGGAGALVLNGSGTMSLAGANTYSGGTTITAGTLSIGAGGTTGSLSTSSTIVNNGALAFNRSNTLTQGADFTASAITGTGALIQNGSGTTILTANQGYTGATIINAGTLQIGNGGTSGSLSTSSAITNNGTLAFNRSDDITQGTHFSANITGTGALAKNGSGNLTIGVANSYTGGTVINAGTLQIRNASALGTSGTISFGGGTLQWGNVTTDLSSRFSTAGGQDFKFDTGTNLVTFNTGISNAGGTVTKDGSNSLRLATANTFSSLTINSGNVRGGNSANTFGGSGASIFMNGGSLSFNTNLAGNGNYTNNDLFIQGDATITNSNSVVGGTATYFLFGNLTIGSNTLTVAPTNPGGTSDAKITITKNTTLTGDATFNVTDRVNNVLALNGIAQSGGVRNLIKDGAGTLQITGSSSFTGTTTINGGVVEAAASNALASTSEVIVNTGGSLLVTADGALGANGITLNSTSTTVAGLAFNGTYNGSLGVLTLSQDSIIDLGSGSVTAIFSQIAGLNDYTLSIYNWTGTTLWDGGDGNNTDQIYFGSGASAHLDRISFYSDFGNSFLGTGYQFSSGSFANEVIPVPEPETYATAVLLLLGCGWLYVRRLRRDRIEEV